MQQTEYLSPLNRPTGAFYPKRKRCDHPLAVTEHTLLCSESVYHSAMSSPSHNFSSFGPPRHYAPIGPGRSSACLLHGPMARSPLSGRLQTPPPAPRDQSARPAAASRHGRAVFGDGVDRNWPRGRWGPVAAAAVSAAASARAQVEGTPTPQRRCSCQHEHRGLRPTSRPKPRRPDRQLPRDVPPGPAAQE